MNKLMAAAAVLFFFVSASVHGADGSRGGHMTITITIGNTSYEATLENAGGARDKITALLPLSLSMQEWAQNSEYYARLGSPLSIAAPAPESLSAGDLALYQGISLVVFYGETSRTAGYVRIGRIADSKNLRAALAKARGKVVLTSAAPKVPGADDDVSQITELYHTMCRAMIAKDISALARLHDENFVLVHMTGAQMNRQEYLEAVRDGTLNYYSAEHDDIHIQVQGNRATLCGKSRVNAAVYGGGRHTWRLQQDMTLEKKNEKWLLTHSTASTY